LLSLKRNKDDILQKYIAIGYTDVMLTYSMPHKSIPIVQKPKVVV